MRRMRHVLWLSQAWNVLVYMIIIYTNIYIPLEVPDGWLEEYARVASIVRACRSRVHSYSAWVLGRRARVKGDRPEANRQHAIGPGPTG